MREIDLDFHALDVAHIDVNLKTIYYFIIVTETRNITKAARELYITQSTLSKNIILLEQRLDVKLFVRNNRNLIPTRAGELLYEKWKPLIKNYCDQLMAVRRIAYTLSERVHIGSFPALDVVDYLGGYFSRIQKKWPGIFIELYRMNNTRCFEYLNSEKIDLLFTLEKDIPRKEEAYHYRRIRKIPIVALISREDELASREVICFSDLHDRKLMFGDPGGALSRKEWVDSYLEERGIDAGAVQFVNNDLTAILNVSGGMGIAIGPECVFGRIPKSVASCPVQDAFLDLALVWLAEREEELEPLIEAVLYA